MNVVLAVDAIVPPLTGIGRYTWELARHYSEQEGWLTSVRFDFAGRWIENPSRLLEEQLLHSDNRIPRFLRVPASIGKWRRRREMRKYLFHSPNYFLPESVDSGIVTVHDLSVFKFPETHPVERLRHFERAFASTLNRSVHLITDSEAIRKEVIDYFGWSPDKITAVHLGVPAAFRPCAAAELAQPLHEYGLSPGNYSLCVSTLEPRKRIDRLLQAYAEIPMVLRQQWPLVLAGSKGWLNEALSRQIAVGESQGWLRYLGFVPEPVLPLLYAGARAFFFPSLYEGFGLPVLEALASGVPVLTSNCSSLPEVADGAAWLVEPDDHAALREGIENVLSNETWRTAAIVRGLQVASEATWAKCARRTLDVYRQFT